jgi:BON domain
MAKIRSFITGALAGAAVAYLWDLDRGRARRAEARDRLLRLIRRTGTKLEREGRGLLAQFEGRVERLSHPLPEDMEPDDGKLKDRIESEVFSSGRFQKGRINIGVVDSVVELRGRLGTIEEIREFEEAVARVPGVVAIESLLHLPGTEAPNKRQALEAH